MLPRATLFACLMTITSCSHGPASPSTPSSAAPGRVDYEVYAIQYGGMKDVPVNALVPGADPDRKTDTAFMIWLIRGHGHTILVDSGFYRERFINDWHPVDYVKPSLAIARLGL